MYRSEGETCLKIGKRIEGVSQNETPSPLWEDPSSKPHFLTCKRPHTQKARGPHEP